MKWNWLIVVALLAGMIAGCKPAETTTGKAGDAKAPGTQAVVKIPKTLPVISTRKDCRLPSPREASPQRLKEMTWMVTLSS